MCQLTKCSFVDAQVIFFWNAVANAKLTSEKIRYNHLLILYLTY